MLHIFVKSVVENAVFFVSIRLRSSIRAADKEGGAANKEGGAADKEGGAADKEGWFCAGDGSGAPGTDSAETKAAEATQHYTSPGGQ